MSFYVKRERDGRTGWTGPIRSGNQADREAQAWNDAGWLATVWPSTPEVRKQVREWERNKVLHDQRAGIIQTYYYD
jgi:hypothetical protein